MRFPILAATAALGLLVGCDEAPTPVAAPAPPETAEDAVAVQAAAQQADELNILSGRDYGGGLVLQGGVAESNVVTAQFAAPVASTANPADIALIRDAVRGNVASSFCSNPSTTASLAQGVVFEVVTLATDGVVIDSFPLAVCV